MSDAYIVRRGGGGAGGLNFKVVGGTERPAKPKENMIWAKTGTEITGWSFSENEPEAPIDNGVVWFETGVSPTSFNALTKNEIILRPISAYQYISGEWHSVDAEIYQDGKWDEWINYIFRDGIGDVSSVGYVVDIFDQNIYTPTIGTTIVMNKSHKKGDGHEQMFVGTSGVIDCSNYTILKCKFSKNNSTSGGFTRLGVSSSKSISASPLAYTSISNGQLEVELPLNGIDSGYIYLGWFSSSSWGGSDISNAVDLVVEKIWIK